MQVYLLGFGFELFDTAGWCRTTGRRGYSRQLMCVDSIRVYPARFLRRKVRSQRYML